MSTAVPSIHCRDSASGWVRQWRGSRGREDLRGVERRGVPYGMSAAAGPSLAVAKKEEFSKSPSNSPASSDGTDGGSLAAVPRPEQLHAPRRGCSVRAEHPEFPTFCELHFGIPMASAVICALNSCLDAGMASVLLQHSEAKVLFVDAVLLGVAREALRLISQQAAAASGASCRVPTKAEEMFAREISNVVAFKAGDRFGAARDLAGRRRRMQECRFHNAGIGEREAMQRPLAAMLAAT